MDIQGSYGQNPTRTFQNQRGKQEQMQVSDDGSSLLRTGPRGRQSEFVEIAPNVFENMENGRTITPFRANRNLGGSYVGNHGGAWTRVNTTA